MTSETELLNALEELLRFVHKEGFTVSNPPVMKAHNILERAGR